MTTNEGNKKEDQKSFKLEEIDLERLKEIEQMQKMLFSSNKQEPSLKKENQEAPPTFNTTKANNKAFPTSTPAASSTKLIEHANFIHNLSENNISPIDIISNYFTKHHSNNSEENNFVPDSNFIPITTNVVTKDNDTIEITRVYLYTDYYNNKPYPTEKIVIKRNAHEKENIFISFFEDKMKKTITTVSADSIYTKVAKFKSFRNPNELMFFQNIFHYRCILDMYNYYKMMNRIPAKKELVLNNLYYHEFMKNLL